MASRHAAQPAGPARTKLRRGLTRRGFAFSTATLVVSRAGRSARASVSPALCDVTARAACRFAAGHVGGATVSAASKDPAREIIRSMLWHRFSVVTLCLLLITTAAATGYQLLSAFAPARQGEPRPVPARQEPRLEAEDPSNRETTFALEPATIIEGQALAADTRKPIAHAAISVDSVGADGGWQTSQFRANVQGRFQANPYPAQRFRVRASAPAGQPYLLSSIEFAWTKGAVKKEVEITMPRGVVLKGKVVEEGTGRPVGGATVRFSPRRGNVSIADVASSEDGTFQATVPPGEGSVLVLGPTLDFIPHEIGRATLFDRDQSGGPRMYPHAIVSYQAKADEPVRDLVATLRPGKTVKGRVTGPQGQTIANAVILTRLDVEPMNLTW